MENNIREIKEKCNVFSKCVDVDLDFQENLMAYNDDMLKIVRCCINNFVINTDYNNGTLTVYGKSKIYLTYVSESTSCLTTADFEEDFQKQIAIEGGFENVTADVFVMNKYSNFRVINQRRIDIHNAFSLSVKVCACNPVKMIDDMPPVLLRKDKISYLSLVGTAYTRAEFEEDTAKATVEFSLLYTTDTENEIIRKCEKSINISKIIDINEIDEGDDAVVNVTIGNMYVKPKADKNNELRMIELLGDVNINASVFRKVEAELSTDSYATDNEISNTFSKLNLNTNGEVISDIINDKCTFEFENINIVEVVDLSLNISDGKNLELAAFVRNEKSELIFISQKKEIDSLNFNSSAIYVKSFDYVINSSNQISVRYLIEYTAIRYEEKTFNVLSEINVSDTPMADSPALVVYFAKEQEQLWDIAKKFRTSVELIKTENELKDDVLQSRRILLIPGM